MNRWLESVGSLLGIKPRTWPKSGVEGFAAQRLLVRSERPTIFDVGAHRGETALALSRHCSRTRLIHCFEPFADSFAALEKAIAHLDGSARTPRRARRRARQRPAQSQPQQGHEFAARER